SLDGLGDDLRAIGGRLDQLDDLDRPHMLALASTRLVVGARARAGQRVDEVSAVVGLRRNRPGRAGDPLDALVDREELSALLPKVRCLSRHTLRYIPIRYTVKGMIKNILLDWMEQRWQVVRHGQSYA